MANQNKFVSVNLNKSYGRPSSPGYAISPSNYYGNASRPRSGSGGGGGMVVLSRPRSSGQKSGPRLSVPPPLNLPSLRKEHERFDLSATTARSAGSGSSSLGHGHGSQAMGWTRNSIQAPSPLQDDDGHSEQSVSKNRHSVSSAAVAVASVKESPISLRAPALRGEDFPSLAATCEASKKRREGTNQKPKQVETEEPIGLQPEKSIVQSSRPISYKGTTSDASSTVKEISQKKNTSLSEPLSLPFMHLNRRSDWADDERDTGFGIPDRDRERGFPRADATHIDDFYAPSREFLRKDSYGRDSVAPNRDSRDSGSWRGGIDRQNLSKEVTTYRQPLHENSFQNSWLNKRTGITPTSRRDSDNHVNRNRGDMTQNTTPVTRTPFSPGSKGYPVNDPVLNFSQDRHVFSNSSKLHVEEDTVFDAKVPSFGGLSGDISIKIFKKKKDAAKQADFYDPVRESFEVELQRVQQLQEMERQRVLEEQTRAIELARKEEEERERLARMEEEQRRKLEEEEREAAWRAEQEKLEASRKADEQRIAREEEKRRILMEEERRKEAAREKLLELEARIARRQAEEAAKDGKNPSLSVVDQKEELFTGNNSSNSDSVSTNRTQSSRDVNPSFADKGKLENPWKKKEDSVSSTLTISIQDQENSRRAFPGKDFFASPVKSSPKGGIFENGNSTDRRWNIASETGDIDTEFLENDNNAGWRHGRSSDELQSSYYSFQNADVDGVSSSGRSRYSLRQPRVLPPPFSSMQRRPFRASGEHLSSSAVSKSSAEYQNRNENEYQDQIHEPVTIPSFEKLSISLQKDEKSSPRCASQSSLSVTSPPSSPTHDDLEDSGLAFSDVDRPSGIEDGPTTLKMSPSSISLEEDDEWEIENNGPVQDQEEYDDEDGYREEEEARDGDDENLALASEHEIPVDSYGEGLEVKLRDSDESSATELNPLTEAREISPKDLSIEPLASVNSLVDSTAVASSLQPSVSSVSTVPSQTEMPMKLQFGLFSGPSLIPPPVPAIQIGSIQMPLHLHPPVAQMHSSQSPFFQFGQMGLLPLAPQGMPFVHPSLPAHYTLTQSQRIVGQDSCIQNTQPTDGQPTGETKNLPCQEKRPVSSDVSRKEECCTSRENNNESESDMKAQPVLVNNRDSQSQRRLTSGEKISKGTRFMNPSAGRGKRYVYKVKNSTDSRPLLPSPEDFSQETSNYQRKSSQNSRRPDFRPRDSGRRQIETLELVNGRTAFHSKNEMNKPNKSTTFIKEMSSKRNLSNIIGHPKRNGSLEEDIDAPLQSGIIRIFNQPGIEVLSDEDDFIEVRSKRQMLNDRREQREKQNKAKSNALKVTRKPHHVAQSNPNLSSSKKTGPVSAVTTNFVTREKSDLSTAQVAPLAPIGTPSITVDADGRSSSRAIKTSISTSRGTKLTSGLPFENNVTMDDIPTSLGPWSDPHIDQQVNMLTMEPSSFEGHDGSLSSEPEKLSTTIKSHEKAYSSSATSLSSVFPGERIQFGAVMSATILPPISRAVSRMSAPEESSLSFLEKEKQNEEPLNDPEDEAEAAASAVAVAAISNDEVVSNELNSERAISRSEDFKGGQMVVNNQSATEEPLTVALPADLSVETPLSLWPPLPSTQTSSTPMISCFPGPTASHFPCYEMNPMMGGPIFAFSGPNDESSGAQAHHLPRNGPAHLGPWSISAHSGVDSFYGPFISPPVGPPHMVVYNHFTPVGQFGQLGQLGFMGAAYIPSGKQPDWKHSSGTVNGNGNGNGGSEGSVGLQRGASPVLPMASPLTMFDLSPFQPSADMPVQARWSHLAAPPAPLHSIPLSVPPPYQVDHSTIIPPSQSSTNTRFTRVDPGMSFSPRSVPRFPEELTLVKPPNQVNQTRPSSNVESTIKIQAFQPPPPVVAAAAPQHYVPKVGSGGDWYRRQGIHQGKNMPSGSEKSFNSAKVKQIYVAKPVTTSGASTSA